MNPRISQAILRTVSNLGVAYHYGVIGEGYFDLIEELIDIAGRRG